MSNFLKEMRMNFFFSSRLVGFGAVLLASASLMSLIALKNADDDIKRANEYMIQEAQMHYVNIMTVRAWASHYGGVFVRPVDGLRPNPYLKEMVNEASLKTQTGETLVKINPAWMTRQLSEMMKSQAFSYRITSDNPINPINRSGDFELEAFAYLRQNPDETTYYRFNENEKKLRYLGGLYIESSCLKCHDRPQYSIGDLRGGNQHNPFDGRYGGVQPIDTAKERFSSGVDMDNPSFAGKFLLDSGTAKKPHGYFEPGSRRRSQSPYAGTEAEKQLSSNDL